MTKTVKVRILVAVDRDGGWKSQGYSGLSDEMTRSLILTDALADGYVFRWITAEVPIPEATDIAGEVE